MIVIEIRRHPWGWKAIEAPGVELCSQRKITQSTTRRTAPASARVRFGFSVRVAMSSALSRQRHESKAVNAATMAADDERFLTGGGIRSPELIAHAGLLQCDFAHELRANDLANIEAFHC